MTLCLLHDAPRRLRGTTMIAPMAWAVGAVVGVTFVEVMVGLQTSAVADWIEPAQFAAACLTFCPTVAILGAKRPQDSAWQLIVLALLVVLALPAVEAWLRGTVIEVHVVRGSFLAILILVGLFNHLPTRFAAAAAAYAAAQTALLWPHLPLAPSTNAEWLGIAGLGLLLLSAMLLRLRARTAPRVDMKDRPLADLGHVWSEFRDWFGSVWSLRVMERMNASSQMYRWPVTLEWDGFVWRPSNESPTAHSRVECARARNARTGAANTAASFRIGRLDRCSRTSSCRKIGKPGKDRQLTAAAFRRGCQSKCHATRLSERFQIEHFIHRVRIDLAAAHRDRRNPVLRHPVRVEAAVAHRALGFNFERSQSRFGREHARFIVLQAKRLVIQSPVKHNGAASAVGAFDFAHGVVKSAFDRCDDPPAEGGAVTASFGAKRHAVGDDVGCVAPVDHADVARAALFAAEDQAVPAFAMELGDGQRRDCDGAYALFGGHSGMAGDAGHVDGHPVTAGRADDHLLDRPAVPIERQLRTAEHFEIGASCAVQTDLLLHRPKERQRRMRQLAAKNLDGRGEHHRHAGAIVGAQSGLWIARSNEFAMAYRLAADANWHGVHVRHQQPSRCFDRARQSEDQVTGFTVERSSSVSLVVADVGGICSGGKELFGDKLGNRRFLAA